MQGCLGTEAKLYDCWYYSVDLGLCSSDVAVECEVGICSLTCQNGGTLIYSTCTCNCADGFTGMDCSSECV